MKKILALILVTAMLALMLTSCTQMLSGSYTSSSNLFGLAGGSVTYTFKGNAVTLAISSSVLGYSKDKTYEGRYKITKDENNIRYITFTFTDADVNSYSGTYEFSEGTTDDGVKLINIDRLTYIMDK